MDRVVPPRFDAFISYDRSNATLARKIAAALQQRGFRTWIDEQQLAAGGRWRESIQQGLNESRFIVAIIAPGTTESMRIRHEWGAGLREDSGSPQLLPLWLGDVEPPPELRHLHGLRISPDDVHSLDAAVEVLARRLADARSRMPAAEQKTEAIRAASASIPALEDHGYLPQGVYTAPATEVLERFGRFTFQRESLSADLVALLERARRMGAESIVLGGSFVSDAPNPEDLDVVLVLPSGATPATFETDAAVILSYVSSGKSTFVATEGDSLDTWISFLSNSHLGVPRGLIRIPIDRGGE